MRKRYCFSVIMIVVTVMLLASCGKKEVKLDEGVIHYPGLAWNMTQEEVMNLADIYADSLEEAELLVSQGEGPSVEGYETWAVIGEDESYYYAWREAGDGWLLVAVYDYTGIDNPNVLLPQFLSYISPYRE